MPDNTTDLRSYLATCNDTVYESLQVPEWENRTVWVRSLTNAEKSAYEESCLKTKRILVNGKSREKQETDLIIVRAKLVVLAICKGENDPTPVFDKPNVDYKILLAKNSAAVERIFDVASRLCGLTSNDVEDLAKNSPANQNAVSG